jgi:PAS domain S-box-containing protein
MTESERFSIKDKKRVLLTVVLISIAAILMDSVVGNFSYAINLKNYITLFVLLSILIIDHLSLIRTDTNFAIVSYSVIFNLFIHHFIDISGESHFEVLRSIIIIFVLMQISAFFIGKRHALIMGASLLIFLIPFYAIADNEYINDNIYMLCFIIIGYSIGLYSLINTLEINKQKELSLISRINEYSEDKAYINTLSISLAEVPFGEEIIPLFLKSIKEHTGASLATFSLFDFDKRELGLKRVEADGTMLKSIIKIAGNNILNSSVAISDEMYRKISHEEVDLADNLNYVSFGAVPTGIDKAIRGLTGWSTFYGISHLISGKLYGTSLLAFKYGQPLPSKDLLQSYGHMTALALRNKKAEQELQRSEANIKAILENSLDSIWSIDTEYRIQYVNEIFVGEFKKIFGVEIAKGVNIVNALPQSISGLWKERYDRALRNEHFVFVDKIEANNSVVFIEVAMNPILLDNKVVGVSFYGKDITERKKFELELIKAKEKAEENEQKLRNTIELAVDTILFINEHGTILDANHIASELTGYQKQELIEKPLKELFCKDSLAEIPLRLDLLLKGEIVTRERVIQRKDNSHVHVEMRSKSMNDGTFQIFVRDITERKNAENERLLKEQLIKQMELARESLNFKQNFLANMSHEMRTPLTGILGMSEILDNTPLDDDQKDYLNTIIQSGNNLKEMINQVLDYSKIEAGKVQLNKKIFTFYNLIEIAENLFVSLCRNPVFFEKQLDPRIPYFIVADEIRLTRVINNLISNAIKFTAEGKISISCELIKKDNKSGELTIQIKIADTGQGIERNTQNKLFKPFFQIEESDTRQYDGSGLGLSICKELVTMHGGDMHVESEPGKGSTFWFTFQALEASAEEIETLEYMQEGSEPPKKLRILLAEDKIVNQKVLQLLLTTQGHTVTLADNGEKVIELFSPGQYDLILMDIQMPVMSGVVATQKLKETYTELPPIVGLSANAFEGDREKYMSKGMDEYLTKPLQIADLNKIIDRFFGK